MLWQNNSWICKNCIGIYHKVSIFAQIYFFQSPLWVCISNITLASKDWVDPRNHVILYKCMKGPCFISKHRRLISSSRKQSIFKANLSPSPLLFSSPPLPSSISYTSPPPLLLTSFPLLLCFFSHPPLSLSHLLHSLSSSYPPNLLSFFPLSSPISSSLKSNNKTQKKRQPS